MTDEQSRSGAQGDLSMLTLPHERPNADHYPAYAEAALRASGLELEIAEALPTRGGALDPWQAWEESAWTGTFRSGRHIRDLPRIAWPRSLYIPRDADYRDYWITAPPSDHRYALAWPAGNEGDRSASAGSGDIFAFANTPWFEPGADARTEAGIGVTYSPDFTLGTVDFEPIVNLEDGMLTAILNHGQSSSGSVTLRVSVVLALWQVIPGGFDLIDYGTFPLARITRERTIGSGRNALPGSLYTPRPFRRRFLVQGGREYLFGAVVRAESISTLTDSSGRKLVIPQPADNNVFTVYAWAKLGIPYMTIDTAQVYQA